MTQVYCPYCASEGKPNEYGLIIEDEGKLSAMKCHQCGHKFEIKASSNANTRTAQFGGGGTSNGSYAPGGSPYGSRMQSSNGTNSKILDRGLDSIMGRTRLENESNFDDSMTLEKRLSPTHTYLEEDAIPYHLTPEERHKLRIKKEVQRREKFYSDAMRSVNENSVPYIKEMFTPKAEHITTMEQKLNERRRNKTEPDPRENEVPAQIRPERTHSTVYSSRIAAPVVNHGTTSIFGPHADNDNGTEEHPLDKKKLTENYVGNMTVIESNSDMERYLDQLNTDNWSAGSGIKLDNPHVPTLMDFSSQEEKGTHQVAHTDPIPSPINNANNPFKSIETLNSEQAKLPNSPLPTDLGHTRNLYQDDNDDLRSTMERPRDTSLRTQKPQSSV